MTQAEFQFSKDNHSTKDRVAMMKTTIMHYRGWCSAEVFKSAFGWSDRLSRSVCTASEGQIISGNRGYITNALATNKEFAQSNNRIYNQARKMLRRALQERRVRHELVGKY